MAKAKEGDTVKVHYTGTLDSGDVFDSSKGKDPLEFELGAGMVINGFDQAIQGMEEGQEKDVKLPPEEAYGDHNPQLVREVPKQSFGDFEPKEGMVVGMMAEGVNQQIPATIKKVKEDKVTVDLNPPLAGKTLNFKIKLVEVTS